MENQNSWMVLESTVRAWMSHGDEAEEIPENFEIIGHTENAHAAAITNIEQNCIWNTISSRGSSY